MEDAKIVALYAGRNERAIEETEKKYHRYCWAIACNILGDPEDAAECVNDAWLAAWNSIPPHSPERLGLYLGKLTRRAALKKLRLAHTAKRGGGEGVLALEELGECLPAGNGVEDGILAQAIAAGINQFLSGLPVLHRKMFVRRYWFLEPVDTIALELDCSRSKVSSILHRTRIKLRDFLMKEDLL